MISFFSSLQGRGGPEVDLLREAAAGPSAPARVPARGRVAAPSRAEALRHGGTSLTCPCVSQQEELHALHLVYNMRTPTDVPESSTEVLTLSEGTAFSAGV